MSLPKECEESSLAGCDQGYWNAVSVALKICDEQVNNTYHAEITDDVRFYGDSLRELIRVIIDGQSTDAIVNDETANISKFLKNVRRLSGRVSNMKNLPKDCETPMACGMNDSCLKQEGDCGAESQPCSKSLEALIAGLWNGRDWHKLTVLEEEIFNRLNKGGYMRLQEGFIHVA